MFFYYRNNLKSQSKPMTYHEDILEKLLEFRKEHPDFNFIPRQRNKSERFEQGYWFPGEERYAFVGLLNNGSINMTRSIGFVFWRDNDYLGCTLEVITKGIKDERIQRIHNKTLEIFDDFEEERKGKYKRFIGDTSSGYDDLLNKFYRVFLEIKTFVSQEDINKELIISDKTFNKLIDRINSYREADTSKMGSKCILANITWNSNDWKATSKDSSNHGYVKDGNVPGESWNFDKDAEWNDKDYIYGYAQFTNEPSETNPPIIVFYSDGKIVGFYGNAEISNYEKGEIFKNLCGEMDLSFVLENKIDDIKSKGFLEGKERIGQIGFNYLKSKENILAILDEALKLNPIQTSEITKLKNWYVNNKVKEVIENNNTQMENSKKLNQLFYGPPGTGKTYQTIAESIKIVDSEFYKVNKDNRKALTERYQDLLITDWHDTKGQIAFCTFHQSFTYEDFVEGIKPKTTPDKQVYYDVEPGIFKKICDEANSSKSSKKLKSEGKLNWSEDKFMNRKAFFYKLSLGEANNPEDREIYEYCRDNGYVSIGFGGDYDYSGMSESAIKNRCEEAKESTSAGSQLSTFIHGLSLGDYIIISKGNKYIRAIGRIIGEYEYHNDFPIRYNHFRKVEWVFVDESIPVEELYGTSLMQRSIYKIDHDKLKKEFFVSDGMILPDETKEVKPYVIIIDEINRGNVASIFGELITLIEPDKRNGASEELKVILPYSKEKFSVPDNVYLIGTMNTADRSVEALDSALRRRFSFKEVMPNYDVIKKILDTRNDWGETQISLILEKINRRITRLIDRDHQIGHSYFLGLKSVKNTEMLSAVKDIFFTNIIPLLQEYFFNDFNKIGLVIGEDFLRKEQNVFAEFQEGDSSDYEDEVFEIIDPKEMNDEAFINAIKKLIN